MAFSIRQLSTSRLPDVSDNRMPTVLRFSVVCDVANCYFQKFETEKSWALSFMIAIFAFTLNFESTVGIRIPDIQKMETFE